MDPEDGHRELLSGLGVDLHLHDQLIAYNNGLHERTFGAQTGRPNAMRLFDEAFHASHGDRVAEIHAYRKKGGKSIGTFCIYVPDEIALAAGVLPIPLCGGTNWSVDHADRMFPRDICPLIRSTFGMAFSNTCPYKKLKDAAVGETTCDAKKKAWDLLGFKVLEVPQRKKPVDRALWREEVREFKSFVEGLSGITVTAERLAEAIRLVNGKRRALQMMNDFRTMADPPISGLDALLVSQAALSMDVGAFNRACEELIGELASRAAQGISAYAHQGPRVLVAGSPSPMGYAKLHHAIETSGMRVVADESCTGIRYYRDLVDESAVDLDTMLDAVADRYFSIDCSCFSPNAERVENILRLVDKYRVDGVVHSILLFCHTYNVEAGVIDRALKKKGVPSLKVVTDYAYEDLERIRVRLEAFREQFAVREA